MPVIVSIEFIADKSLVPEIKCAKYLNESKDVEIDPVFLCAPIGNQKGHKQNRLNESEDELQKPVERTIQRSLLDCCQLPGCFNSTLPCKLPPKSPEENKCRC